MNIFDCTNQRDVLQRITDAQSNQWGYQTKLAKAAGCQKPYLSRVLGGTASLSADQAYGISTFVGFSAEETEFFVMLIHLEKASSPAYRKHLKSQIDTISKNKRQLVHRLAGSKTILTENTATYYSAWYWSAVHILIGIPGFQKEEKIAARLELPVSLIKTILEYLAKQGLVRRDGANWVLQEQDVHLPNDSSAILPYHHSWRQKALLYKPLNRECDFYYSSVQSIAKKDLETLRTILVTSIQKLRQAVRESPQDEELIGINCDFFVL